MNKWFLLSGLVVVVYLSPLLLLGQDAVILSWDNLDSLFVLDKVLAHSSTLFSASSIPLPEIMNGVPRLTLGSEYRLAILLHYFFEPFTVLIFNEFIIRLIALLGMYTLLSKHFCNGNDQKVALGVATVFAVLPFWSPGGLNIAGMPLLLYAFLNIRKNQTVFWDWLILLAMPFHSSLVVCMLFFLITMGILLVYDTVRNRSINFLFLLALLGTTGVSLLLEYRLVVYSIYDTIFVSHRVERYVAGGSILYVISFILGDNILFCAENSCEKYGEWS